MQSYKLQICRIRRTLKWLQWPQLLTILSLFLKAWIQHQDQMLHMQTGEELPAICSRYKESRAVSIHSSRHTGINMSSHATDGKKEDRRRTGLSAPASRVIGLWTSWVWGPSSLTQPIRLQVSCSQWDAKMGWLNYIETETNFEKFSLLITKK